MSDLDAIIVTPSIFRLIDTQCYRLGEDVPDLRLEMGVERHATVAELFGLRKVNS